MAATENTGLGHGTNGFPQYNIEEQTYPLQTAANEALVAETRPPVYAPSPKHESRYGWGSANPIKTQEEGQRLLDTGYRDGRQIYNITSNGQFVKFQPDGTAENGYHSYVVYGMPDIPPYILKKMMVDGKISQSQYNKSLKGKRKRGKEK